MKLLDANRLSNCATLLMHKYLGYAITDKFLYVLETERAVMIRKAITENRIDEDSIYLLDAYSLFARSIADYIGVKSDCRLYRIFTRDLANVTADMYDLWHNGTYSEYQLAELIINSSELSDVAQNRVAIVEALHKHIAKICMN